MMARPMSADRALSWTLIVFSVSLAGVGLAAMSAWLRCDRPGACSTELALSIAALAPTALILALMLLLLRARTASPLLRRLLLIFLFGAVSAPLSAFLLRDLGIVAIVAVLLSVGVGIALYSDADGTSSSRESVHARQEASERAALAARAAESKPPNFIHSLPMPGASCATDSQTGAVIRTHQALVTGESLSRLTVRLQAADNLTVSLTRQLERLIADVVSK